MFSSWPDFFAFFYRSTVGCLLGCFGMRDVSSRPSSPLVSQPDTEITGFSRNRKRLNSLPLPQEGTHGSPGNENNSDLLDSPQHDLDFQGLRDQAKFLKACGTLPETPAEIRKASIILTGSSPIGDSESPRFHSWLPNTSIQKLNLEMEPEQPSTPNKQCEDWVISSGSSAHEPNSSLKTGQMISTSAEDSDAGKFGMGAHNYTSQTASVQSKSVRFYCPSDTSLSSSKRHSSEAYGQSSEQSESCSDERASKLSPNPTPLQLTDDMQTPGTVFPSYIGNMVVGKNPRIRTQYVQSLANLTENHPHIRLWMEERSSPHQESGHLIKSFEQADSATPDSEVRVSVNSVEEGTKVEESFSSCMKPLPPNQCANDQRVVTFASDNTYFGKTPGDRPVLGTVAIHWNEDESSLISPKWWDAMGIPNSTTKYKEDQKVSWHTTPFEERLEKALSEKHIISQRRNLNGAGPLDFNENKERDCAVSVDM